MTFYEIAQWALENGFKETASASGRAVTMECEHAGSVVRLVVDRKMVRTHVLRSGMWHPLRKARPEDVSMDFYGMLQGAGLVDDFVDRMYRGEQAPRWFPPAFRTAVLAEIAGSSGENANAQPAWHEIEDWLEENGFEEIDEGYFEAEYMEGRIGVLVTDLDVTSLWLMPDDEHVIKSATYDELYFDDLGMLQGAGLDRKFRELAAEGEALPYWFPADYAESVRMAGRSVNGAVAA